jgi:predicted acyltransferase
MLSLDVFRGITIAAMILVNDPGSWDHIYAPLKHAEWNGCTPTDVIFPFFLFIVGVSLTLSFEARIRRGASRASLALHLLRRSAILFAIGFALNALEHLHPVRIMGVLQRIALCYLAAGALYLWTRQSGMERRSSEDRRTQRLLLAAAIATLLIGYWALMIFIPVPGYGAGHLGPENNLAAYIDRTVMGSHLWSESQTWDPEGLLSNLPAIASVLIGILAAEWLTSSRWQTQSADRPIATRLTGLTIAGGVLVAAGLLLNPYFPINKNLWTSSFVLFTGGWALLFLALCHGVIDVLGWRKGIGAFLVFGRNAIFGYSISALLAILGAAIVLRGSTGESHTLQEWLYQTGFRPFASGENASLGFAVCFVLFIFVLIWPLDRRKIFIRI